jgi:hypothetical protein
MKNMFLSRAIAKMEKSADCLFHGTVAGKSHHQQGLSCCNGRQYRQPDEFTLQWDALEGGPTR